MKTTKLFLVMLFSIAVVACGGGGGSAPAAPALPAGYVAQGGLTWMPVTFADSWANANAYCANTTLNGQTGWRMPTQAELSALVSSGAIPSIGWSLAYTWSSTAYVPVAGYYYIVSLYNGGAAYQHGGGANYVSCVRGSISATATTTAQSLGVGVAMSFSPLTPIGGATPYTYSYTGTLPAGLSFNTSTGAVTGTPTTTYATANLVFSVKDANNVVASTTSTVNFTVSLFIPSATATTTAQSLSVGTAMTSFSPLTPSGGAPPYIYSYTGTLPAGLSFNTSTGAVTGTPTATYATASLVFSVKDANNLVASTTSTVNFTVVPATSATATTTAQNLIVGTPMASFSPLTPSGGAPPYTYSYTGTLPTGLIFSTSTGAVTGTPTATYSTASLVFSVKDTTNSVASTTSTVSFTVAAAYVLQGGLTWMPVTFSNNWANANAYCTTTTINGQTGWRMPTQAELSALYTSGAMNGQGWTLWIIWSSTVYSAGTHYAVGMVNGAVSWYDDTDVRFYVSCVR